MRPHARVVHVLAMQQRADDDIVLDAERRKRPHDLEGAADAAPADAVGRQAVDALAGEGDRSGVGREHAGDHVEQRGLAGAVRPDDRENAALGHLEADPVDRDQAAEPLAHAIDRQQRAHFFRSARPIRLQTHGHTPSGSAVITSSRQMP